MLELFWANIVNEGLVDKKNEVNDMRNELKQLQAVPKRVQKNSYAMGYYYYFLR